MFTSIPRLDSLDASRNPSPVPSYDNQNLLQALPDVSWGHIFSRWKITVLFSINEPGFLVFPLGQGGYVQVPMCHRGWTPGCHCLLPKAEFRKLGVSALYTDSQLFLYIWGPRRGFPRSEAQLGPFFFFLITAVCLKQKGSIKCELMETTWLEVSVSKSNLLFYLKLSPCLQ